MDCKEIIEFAANLLTCASIFGSAIFYWVDKHHDQRAELSHELSEMFDFYYKNIRNADDSELYSKRVQFMSKLNRLAEKVDGRCLAKRYIRKKASIFLIHQYDEYIHEYILQRRKQFKREDYYEELEQLMKYLRK